MRKIGIAIIVVLLVIVGAALIFAATFDVNKYRGTIQTQLQKRLGRPVTLGDMHLTLFPPRFRVQNLTIADDPHFSSGPFVKAKELDVSVQLLPLLHKQVEINSLDLERPSFSLIKNQAGVWNFASLGHAQTTQKPAASPEQQFSLGELVIRDAQVSILDQAKSRTPSLYDHIQVTLKNFAPNQPFTIDAAAHMAGAGGQEVRLQGKGGPLGQQDPVQIPFRGILNLKQVGIADLAKFLNSPALNGTNGILTGQTSITSESGKLTANGETNIQNAKVHGMDLGYPISAQYDLTDELPVDKITIRKFTAKLGSTPIDMSGTVNAKPTPAQIDLNIKANNVSVAEAAKLAAASGMALSPGVTVTGNVNANIRATGAADKPALNGTVTAANLQMSGKDLPQPVQVQSVSLNLTPSDVRSNPFNVVSAGTAVTAQFNMHNYTSPSPVVDASVRAPNAQLPAILAMAKAYGVTALDKVSGAGVLNVDLRASGPVKQISSSEILKALNGTVNLNLNNVKYSGADIGHELGAIAGFLGGNPTGQAAQGITNILKLTGNILIKSGIAQTNDLKAQLDIGNVGLAGTANLATEALNMRATAVLSQAVSQRVGGQNIGGYMKTALANNQGELVIPALISGTFSKPRFEPDVQQLAQMRLKGLVPDINNPASVTNTLQNFLGGPRNPGQGQQQPQQSQPQNPLQDFLGAFGKKKPK
ncbi:MAG TPA: AsmA family protein [Terriglobales bacterium]|nr:AsmA family protein [Terriglobales bacterium]